MGQRWWRPDTGHARRLPAGPGRAVLRRQASGGRGGGAAGAGGRRRGRGCGAAAGVRQGPGRKREQRAPHLLPTTPPQTGTPRSRGERSETFFSILSSCPSSSSSSSSSFYRRFFPSVEPVPKQHVVRGIGGDGCGRNADAAAGAKCGLAPAPGWGGVCWGQTSSVHLRPGGPSRGLRL